MIDYSPFQQSEECSEIPCKFIVLICTSSIILHAFNIVKRVSTGSYLAHKRENPEQFKAFTLLHNRFVV
jgi:hypothetical protein